MGYGNTYISLARLVEAVRVISGGAVWLGQKVIQQLILESYSKAKEQVAPGSGQRLAGLTPAEHKVAELVAQGQSNLEIAFNLKITERTVKAHLTSIYEKTKTGSRLSLALLINRGVTGLIGVCPNYYTLSLNLDIYPNCARRLRHRWRRGFRKCLHPGEGRLSLSDSN